MEYYIIRMKYIMSIVKHRNTKTLYIPVLKVSPSSEPTYKLP